MNIIKNIKFSDIAFSSVISIIFTLISYNFLYKICRYKNLADFYTGITIYNDHNKYLDIWIYFIYLILFFLVLALSVFIKNKFFSGVKQSIQSEITDNSDYKTGKLKDFLLKYQYAGVLGFIFIHPFNGNFYPKLAIIIIILTAIAIIDIRNRNKNEQKSFSPFILAAVIFILFHMPYNAAVIPVDNHHFGERFAVFFMHNNFNLQYYKDIMLVHGLSDVIPAWFGVNIFNENGISGFCFGEILYRNLIFIFCFTSLMYVFNSNPLYAVPFLFAHNSLLSCLFICSYLLLLKKEVINRPFLALNLFIVISFIFISMWTTIGSFWIFSALPFLFYVLYKTLKSENINKYLKFIIPLLLITAIFITFHCSVIEYIKAAPDYIKGSLFAFGNDFDSAPVSVFNVCSYFTKMFVLLFLPVLIIELIKQLSNKNQDVSEILFFSFSVLLPLVSLNYMLGRIDGMIMLRLSYLSVPYLLIILPYFIYKFGVKTVKTVVLLKIIFVIAILFQSVKIFTDVSNEKYISKSAANLEKINNIKEFVNNKGENTEFLDLTNSGLLYFYLNKKIPVKYISFYNSISSRQSNESAEKIKKNLPDIVLIKTDSSMFDMVLPSLRINSLYREILLSRHYKVSEYKGNIFLEKTQEERDFNEDELNILDNTLSIENLKFLPEVWANSIKKLPLKKLNVNYYGYTDGNSIIIKFNNRVKAENIDLLYLSVNNPSLFTININNSNSELKCKSKTGKILIPLDNYPSWLLNDNLNEIVIETNLKNIDSFNVEFYKRMYK